MRDGWVETTLDGIAEYINGFPFKPTDLGERGTPVIRIKQLLDPNEPVDRTEIETPERCVLRNGDIVFSWSGTLAVRIWNRGTAKLNQHLFRVIEKEGVYKNIIPLILEHALEELEEKSHGTTMKHITKQTLLPHKVFLPPLAEQKRIVNLISSVDSYIEALQQQVDKARKSRNAVLHELLTKGGKGWVETTLGNICDFINGDRGKNYPSAKFRQSHGIPFINAGHLDNGVVNFDNMDFISDEVFERLGGGKIQPGDTLFCLRGSVGKFANVGNLERGAIASSLVIIRPNFLITKDFLMHYLDSELCASELKQSLTGAVQPNLSANNLKSFKVFLPNIQTQNEIGNVLSHFNNLITLIDHLIASTKKLRSALLSDLLSGNHEIPITYDKRVGAA
jgi:type I restriction enzyme S subunit